MLWPDLWHAVGQQSGLARDDALAVGDKVLTFDHGMQAITGMRRAHLWLDAPDTAQALVLLPDQGVMIESDSAHDLTGDPFVILTAHSLVGLRGIRRRQPMHRVELVALYFTHDEVVYAEGGALIHCPADMSTLDKFMEAATPTYRALSGEAAQELAVLIAHEDRMSMPVEAAAFHSVR